MELKQKVQAVTLACKTHGKYQGWRMKNPDDMLINSECPLCAEEQARAEVIAICNNHLQAAAKAEEQETYKAACIPRRFSLCGLREYKAICEQQRAAHGQMVAFVTGFDQVLETGQSYLFLGATGTGKTHLACAVANNIQRIGRKAVYVSMLDFFSRVKRAWTVGSEESEDSIISSYVDADLLILDEIGKGTLNATELGMIFRLIDRRYEEQKPIIGCSNLNRSQLVKALNEDTVRRLGDIIEFNWKPYHL